MLSALFLILGAFGVSDAPQFTLPAGIVPQKHIVEITIDPSRDSFTGVARIAVLANVPQSTIWINGRDLTVQDAWIESGDKRVAAKFETAGNEFIGITPEKPIERGEHVIGIRYSAPLSSDAVAGPNRKKQGGEWYAFTTFTPIDARRAFPCFDEPRFKTIWEVSMRVRKEHRAFANAPMIDEKDEPNGWKLVRFAPTHLIAAEVVAFAVGPFDVYDGGKAGAKSIPVEVITARGQADQGKEAAAATQVVLPRLEKYMGTPYPWDKLDHVALPAGAFGAVENPGLITYQAGGLLVGPNEVAEDKRRRIRSVETHELGHQWFGNLVTQSDWIDVYLSEGFATWITAKLMDEDEPADRKRLAAVASRERIIAADDAGNSHPVRWPMHNRKELENVYNRFAYDKGGAILLMLENWMGEARFQFALQRYLQQHQNHNASTDDLEAVMPPEARPVMDAFLNTVSVPVVKATMQCDQGKLLLQEQGPGPVPVCWKSDRASECTLVDHESKTVNVAGCPTWIYLNAGASGYYRTAWTEFQLKSLAAEGLAKLTSAERLTLVYDLRALRPTEKLGSAVTDPLLRTLVNDTQPEVAHAAKVALGLEKDAGPRR